MLQSVDYSWCCKWFSPSPQRVCQKRNSNWARGWWNSGPTLLEMGKAGGVEMDLLGSLSDPAPEVLTKVPDTKSSLKQQPKGMVSKLPLRIKSLLWEITLLCPEFMPNREQITSTCSNAKAETLLLARAGVRISSQTAESWQGTLPTYLTQFIQDFSYIMLNSKNRL